MDETNREQKQGMCSCPMCNMYGGHRHVGLFILRWLLGIVILLIVFWMGIQIGQFRAFAGRGGYGMSPRYQMMGGVGSYGQLPMMRTGSAVPMIPASGSAAATPTPTK